MKADDLRELRRATKAVKQIARDMREMFGETPAPAPPEKFSPAQLRGEREIPQDYSYVRCAECGAPALLVRDNTNACFAACCLKCCTITHLESIIEEKS